jgi:hypothetical protein
MKSLQRLITKTRFYPWLFFFNLPLNEVMLKVHGFDYIIYHYENYTGLVTNNELVISIYLYNRITFIVNCKGMNINEIEQHPEKFIVMMMIVG